MHKPDFAIGQIYHVYNRGVEKRTIFQNNGDYFRFIHDLFEFNDEQPVIPINSRFALAKPSTLKPAQLAQSLEVEPLKIKPLPRRKRKLLVEILAFCLMPNHFHLLLRQKAENGIPLFMQKLGTGYTMSFNKKYERVGPLFQGSFKAVAVDKDVYFSHLPFYIHANPVELVAPNWHKEGIKDMGKVMDFLEDYRWSSYRDYLGEKNFPSVTQREPLLNLIENPTPVKLRKQMQQWLENFQSLHALTMEAVQIEKTI